jgi:hypothetical protein
MCNTYRYITATMVLRTRLNVTLCVYRLTCWNFCHVLVRGVLYVLRSVLYEFLWISESLCASVGVFNPVARWRCVLRRMTSVGMRSRVIAVPDRMKRLAWTRWQEKLEPEWEVWKNPLWTRRCRHL